MKNVEHKKEQERPLIICIGLKCDLEHLPTQNLS